MLRFTDKEANIIRHLPEVELFSRVSARYSDVVYGKESVSANITGVESDFQRIHNKPILSGRFINERDLREQEKIGVIDERLMESLGASAQQIVGQYVKVGELRFRVVGVCGRGERWDGATLYIPFSTHQSLFSTNHKFDKMSLTMTSGTRNIETKVKNLLAGPMQFDKSDPFGIGVWSQEESVEEQQRVMGAIRLLILILGLCTLVSGAVGVSNIMLVSVRERTKELGIRKALGAPPSTVMWSVVGESLAITSIFGFIGVLLGSGLMSLVGAIMSKTKNAVFVNPSVDAWAIIVATLILIVIGVVAGAIPAYRAMRIKPIEAMNADK
jgi:putative ABC transport system permease protein